MLKSYLGRFYFSEDIMDNLNSYLAFLYNSENLKTNDITPIEKKFASPMTYVYVNTKNDFAHPIFLIYNYEENELLYLIGKQIREEIYGPDSADCI